MARRGSQSLYRAAKRWLRGFVLRDPVERAAYRWFRDGGDDTLRLDYPLSEASVVLDLGGYEGDWAAAIHNRYACAVYVFEPVQTFLERMHDRFAGNNAIHLYGYGLHSKNENATIRLADNASSVFSGHEAAHRDQNTEVIRLRDVVEVFGELGLHRVNLAKINIEGGEYELLERLIESGLVHNIEHIQIQFHKFVTGAAQRRDYIRKRLRETHQCTYNYEFIWESWSRTRGSVSR